MASKKQKRKNQSGELSPEKSARQLGFASFADYREFCQRHQIKPGFWPADRIKAIRKEEALKKAVKQKRKGRKTKNVIEQIFSATATSEIVDAHKLNTGALLKYKKSLGAQAQKDLLDFILYLDKKSKLVNEEYLPSLLLFFKYKKFWISEYEGWKAPSHNKDKQLSSLARHLFTKYPIPTFMDKAWQDGLNYFDLKIESEEYRKYREWFIELGNGKNLRKLNNLPFPITKKVAHHFLKAPSHFRIMDAFRWGQVHALGGDGRLVGYLLGSSLRQNYAHHEFWETVIKFFIDNPMLDYSHVGPIIDYIKNQKFEQQQTYVNGQWQTEPPPQPNFCMRGRNPETLLRQVEGWHRALQKLKGSPDSSWEHSNFKDYEYIEKAGKQRIIWRITELCNKKELAEEGRKMHHCVGSYASSCARRRVGIWSLTGETRDSTEMHENKPPAPDISRTKRFATIEVDLENKTIVQARGKYNEKVSGKARNIMTRWAGVEKLKVGRYF